MKEALRKYFDSKRLLQSDLLFDQPGPRGHRRIRIITIISVLAGLLLIALAIRQFATNGQLTAAKWRPYGTWPMWRYLLDGLANTALAAVLTLGLGLVFGLLLAFARLARNPVLRYAATAYIEAFRVIPAILLVFFMLFALPKYGLDLPLLWKLVIPLTMNRAAQLAVVFRAGILGLERGQGEAASALGLRHSQAMYHVVLPQAIRKVVPALVSQTVGIVKDTSLGYLVSYMELLRSGQVLAQFNQLLIQSYLVVVLIYFVVNYALSRFARWLEARQRTGGKVTESDKATDDQLLLEAR